MATSRIVLTGDSAWHSAEAKALKSCAPTSACPAAPHRLAIERAKGPAGEAALERGPHGRLEQQVVVAPADRGRARVEARGNEAAPLDGDVAGQVAIGAAHPAVERTLGLGVEVDDLVERMHAGIGAAGADRLERCRPRTR
jgi:hypothetical protein